MGFSGLHILVVEITALILLVISAIKWIRFELKKIACCRGVSCSCACAPTNQPLRVALRHPRPFSDCLYKSKPAFGLYALTEGRLRRRNVSSPNIEQET